MLMIAIYTDKYDEPGPGRDGVHWSDFVGARFEEVLVEGRLRIRAKIWILCYINNGRSGCV